MRNFNILIKSTLWIYLKLNLIQVIAAWKAVQSEAIVTGDEVLGEDY